MALQLRWVGEEDYDRVAMTRTRAFKGAGKDYARVREELGKPEPYKAIVLAERDGEAIGTATDLKLRLWVRGGAVACQGVAWVGTIKTARRRGAGEEHGVASRVMNAILDKARERGDAASALMPFRASFYEHFGYGVVERRCDWTVPLAVLPHGDFSGYRYFEPGDEEALRASRQRECEGGHCDIEAHPGGVSLGLHLREEGFLAVDRADRNGPIEGYFAFTDIVKDNRMMLRTWAMSNSSHEAFLRQLHFIASLKDQYTYALLQLPADVPLNWLTRERQIPHRLVEHPAPEAKLYTRMQLRVLDHRKFIEAMKLSSRAAGEVTVSVHESEGHKSTFTIQIDEGKTQVRPSEATAEFECADKVWAAVVCGEIPASRALRLNLASGTDAAAAVLDSFAIGRVPFCKEYF